MKKRMLALLLLLCSAVALLVPACAAEGETGFADVAEDAWYAEAVAYCRANGLMSGTSPTAFSPDEPTSRAMVVTVLHRAAGSPAAEGDELFTDVPEGAWYTDAVRWAAAQGIVGEYSDGRFGPGDPVTREQLAAILWRRKGSPAAGSAQAFADQALIAGYAAGAVAWARETGIVGGKEGDRFDPQGRATRAETAAILQRYRTQGPAGPSGEPGGKVLVAYFSRTGTTEQVAETLAQQTGGDLFAIEPQAPYPSAYEDVLQQARQELDRDARPALAGRVEDMEQYDVILLGFPIWHGNTPMVVRTFLESYDFAGKTIAPFATSGSSGIGPAVEAIRALCPGAELAEGLCITSATLDQGESLAARWVEGLSLPAGQGMEQPVDSGEEQAMPIITITAGERVFTATLQDSPTTRALVERLPLAVTMGELNGNEKYHYFTEPLPTDALQPGSIQSGDLMLYGPDCLVLFYQSFASSYSYTRLGAVDDPVGLADALGSGPVEVTFQAK